MPRSRPARVPSSSGATGPLFPPRQAFVVHFQADSDASGRRFAGRVEHVLSGRGARFQHADDLLAFMRTVLRDLAEGSDARDPSIPTPRPALAREADADPEETLG